MIKKICSLLILSMVSMLFFSACTIKEQKSTMVQAKRRFAKYVEPQKNKNVGRVDLSEGPRLRYDADFGPKTPNFDIKIVNPY